MKVSSTNWLATARAIAGRHWLLIGNSSVVQVPAKGLEASSSCSSWSSTARHPLPTTQRMNFIVLRHFDEAAVEEEDDADAGGGGDGGGGGSSGGACNRLL